MKEKPQPTLADRFIHAHPGKISVSHGLGAKFVRALQARARLSEKIIFDSEATRRVGEVLYDIPELLVEQIEFARPPFDLCWIEYQGDAMWSAIMKRDPNSHDPTRDVTIGILIDHNRINVLSLVSDGEIGVLPFAYNLNTEWPLEDQLRFGDLFGSSRLGIDHWLWGSLATRLDAEHLRALRDITMVEHIGFDPEKVPAAARYRMLDVSAGDFKNIVGLLLMLNQPAVTNYVRVDARRGWIGNQPRPFMSYHNIRVSLDAKARTILLAKSSNKEGMLRRRHRYRGHFCQNKTARTAVCVHDWQPTRGPETDWELWIDAPLDEREHWVCATCHGRRWWRNAGERGDASVGYTYHPRYDVIASEKPLLP